MKLDILPFNRLTLVQCYEAMAVRNAVFCVEQRITDELELDGLDPFCDHVLLQIEGQVVGTARLHRVERVAEDAGLGGCRDAGAAVPFIKVGRLALLAEYRGAGHGRAIMDAVNTYLDCRTLRGRMHAQRHLEDWYASLGWRTVGEPFDEVGIPHVVMVRDPRG